MMFGAYCVSAYVAHVVMYVAAGVEFGRADIASCVLSPITYPIKVTLATFVFVSVEELHVEIRAVVWSLAAFGLCMVCSLAAFRIVANSCDERSTG